MKKLFIITAAVMLSANLFAQSDNNADKQKEKEKKEKEKKENDEKFTVHKSGDAGGGSPTYSTGGLNPNPPKDEKKKEKPKKK